MNASSVPSLDFRGGTLELRGFDAAGGPLGELTVADPRSGCLRAPAVHYAAIVRAVYGRIPFEDRARAYDELDVRLPTDRTPRDYQEAALQAWLAASARGVVVLPTGAGKSFVAAMAIAQKRRSTLVVVPTLDLMQQWHQLLSASFGVAVGLIGGGDYRLEPLTVTTYDSAYIHMENIGNRFGLVVFDECHHLPSEAYALAAKQCLAPYRLGLSATPARTDGRESELEALIGPVVYEEQIRALRGSFLAEYDIRRLEVELSAEERAEYEASRTSYLAFVRKQGIRMGTPTGFGDFIMRSAATEEGRAAMRAYRRQKELALASSAKLELVGRLLVQHAADRTLIFTQDNRTAYEIGRRFLLPVISHQTKVSERTEILNDFKRGTLTAIATSKVLNEGVDVPEASAAIVVSGSGSVREHVQRLGRILRPREGKRAQLYEILSASTNEADISERRREHDAYR